MAKLDEDLGFLRGFRLNLPSLEPFSENSEKMFIYCIQENLTGVFLRI